MKRAIKDLMQRFCVVFPHGTLSFSRTKPHNIKRTVLFFECSPRHPHLQLSHFSLFLATKQQQPLSLVDNYTVSLKKHPISVGTSPQGLCILSDLSLC